MKTLSRNELKQVNGGLLPFNPGMYYCDCGFSWHPEWGQWEQYYDNPIDMLQDALALCGNPPTGLLCSPI